MLREKLQERLSGIACIGISMAFIGGVAGFFSARMIGALLGLAGGLVVGVGVGVVLVALYVENQDEDGESAAAMSRMNAGPLPTGLEE
jgi:hypothetical protein